ncbi:MAG: HAMP domain-containing sensor histidine kinase [Vicinamibacterales bacterium]
MDTSPDSRPSDSRAPSESHWVGRLSDLWDMGVVVLDTAGDVEFANARARTLLRLTSDADLRAEWPKLKHAVWDRLERPTPPDGRPVEMVLELDPGGSPHEVRLQAYGLDEDECAGFLVLVQDEPRASAVERSLRHAARDRALASLYRDWVHDLKGELNIVGMNLELVDRALGRRDEAAEAVADRSLDLIRRAVARLDRSIEIILDRRLVDRDAPQAFDLVSLCRGLTYFIAARAARQRVEVHFEAKSEPVEVTGFADRVHAAILNLLVNALDAMPQGGRLEVTLEGGRTVRLRISDTGAGIPQAMADDIWRLHHTTRPGGTGIGLYVARTTIEAHGGRLTLQPSVGACFEIELPGLGSR